MKWLTRIQITDQRFAGYFMARDYVTMREETVGDQTVWTFSTVSHDRLKSAPARVLEQDGSYLVQGAAWVGRGDRRSRCQRRRRRLATPRAHHRWRRSLHLDLLESQHPGRSPRVSTRSPRVRSPLPAMSNRRPTIPSLPAKEHLLGKQRDPS